MIDERNDTSRDLAPEQAIFELRNGSFYLNGERMPVNPRSVRLALTSHRIETGADLTKSREPQPTEVVQRILRVERERALRSLAVKLARIDRLRGRSAAGADDAHVA